MKLGLKILCDNWEFCAVQNNKFSGFIKNKNKIRKKYINNILILLLNRGKEILGIMKKYYGSVDVKILCLIHTCKVHMLILTIDF